MDNPIITTKSELIHKIDAASADIESFLADLTDVQMTDRYDDQGWNVRDHINHLAVWEESIAMLFHGKPRYESLGIDASQYSSRNFDEINAIIRERLKNLSRASAMDKFRHIHNLLMTSVQTLTDAELNQPAGVFFPQVPANDQRTVLKLIEDNTADHYLEHLPWMEAIATSGK